MIVPRSKVKSGFLGGFSLFLVVESDPSFPLTQSVLALDFPSVTGQRCATDHSRP